MNTVIEVEVDDQDLEDILHPEGYRRTGRREARINLPRGEKTGIEKKIEGTGAGSFKF